MSCSRLLVLATLLWASPASACGSLFSFSESMTAMSVGGEGRVHYRQDAADRRGCPEAGEACRRATYLVRGDVVVVTRIAGAFACASFSDRRGRQTSGWLPAAALVAGSVDAERDWTGEWTSGPEQRITITRADSQLRARGEASWGGSDPARVERGAVNVGEFDARFEPQRADAGFTIAAADGVTLAYDQGRASDCRLRLARRGPYLLVEDSGNCGGQNVSFSGIYRRR